MGTGTQQFSLRWNNYVHYITDAFNSLRTDEDLVDVTLSCEGRRIFAHKVLLSACSSYFREVFKENPCKHPVVILKNVKFEDLEALVDFMYHGQVNVEQERLSSFLTTAELLAVQGLVEGPPPSVSPPQIQLPQRSPSSLANHNVSTSCSTNSQKFHQRVAEESSKKRAPSPQTTTSATNNVTAPSTRSRVQNSSTTPRILCSNNTKHRPKLDLTRSSPPAKIRKQQTEEIVVKKEDLFSEESTSMANNTEERLEEEILEDEEDSNVLIPSSSPVIKDEESGLELNPGTSGGLELSHEIIREVRFDDDEQLQEKSTFLEEEDEEDDDDDDDDDTVLIFNEEHLKEWLKTRPVGEVIEFRDDVDLDDPLRRVLTKQRQKLYQCHSCCAVFSRADSLQKHESKHLGKTTCPICEIVFSRSAHCNRHIRKKHPEYKLITQTGRPKKGYSRKFELNYKVNELLD